MNSKLSQTLWSDVERSRFFLIPSDRQLPPGDFPLRTITGRQMEVEPQSLTPFEVTREEATAWLKSQLGNVIEEAKGKLINYFSQLGAKSQSHPQTQNNQENAVKLEKFADEIEQTAGDVANYFRTTAQKLQREDNSQPKI